jgi:WD40 repeat protein
VIRNYHLSTVTRDKQKHEGEISKVLFISQIKHLLIIENFSKKLKVYNYINGNLLYSFEAHSGSIICAEFMSGQNVVITSGSDNALKFWDTTKNYQLMVKIPTKEIQIVIRWVESKKMLLTGGFDCVINCYKKLEFEEKGKLKNNIDMVSMKAKHTQMITDILVIEQNNVIISCDLAGVIYLWNLITLEDKRPLGSHNKGCLCLSYLESKNLLLSTGYEHQVYVWDIVVGEMVSTLQGHSQSLIGVKIFPGTYQIITGDVSGIFKIWDYRTMSLVQTFTIPTAVNKKANSFCVTNSQKKRIIVGADKVYFFDYEESQEGNLADSKLCISLLYNDVFNYFVSAHLDCIKIWDAETGSLKQVFRDLIEGEISYVCFDNRKRKLFIGDVDGRLILINILNGVQMKYFSKHKNYISSLAYYNFGKKLISGSWDGLVKIHDDMSAEEKGQLLYDLGNSSGNSCNSIDFNEKMGILASGFDNGNVTLINMRSLSSEGTLTDHKKVIIVKYILEHPALIVCDQYGIIHFWSLVPTKPKKLIREFTEENKSNNENNKKEVFSIKCLCYEDKNKVIMTCDETGWIKIWDIKSFITYIEFISKLKVIHYNDPVQQVPEDHPDYVKPFDGDTNDLNCFITLDRLNEYKLKLNMKATKIKEWKGHKNGVSCCTCNSDPVFFVTSGLDLKVHIWSGEYELIGSLTTICDPNWNLKFDIESQKKKKRQKAIILYESSKTITYESLFEGNIKLYPLDK